MSKPAKHMKPFTESERFNYPALTPDSCVMDIGGFAGSWAFEINRKYGCRVWVFEPATAFYNKLVERFKDNPKITVMNAAVGSHPRVGVIGVNGDSTGFFQTEGEAEHVVVMSIFGMLELCPHWGLIKINAEGAEFEIMESVLVLELAQQADNWQIQFHHVVPDADKRYADIRAGLEKTHQLTFDAPWCWQNWEMRP